MLEILPSEGRDFRYRVSGVLTAGELARYYVAFNRRYREHGKLDLHVEVVDFRGYANLDAVKVFLRHEPGLLRKVRRYRATSNQGWFRWMVRGLDFFIPQVKLEIA